MLDYQTYKLLNETLGLSALGLSQYQNLGLNVEGGFPPVPPPMGGGAGGPPMPGGGDDMGDLGADPAGDDAPPSDDDQGDQDPQSMERDDLIAALVDLGHDQDELDSLEDDELRDMLTAEQGGDEGEASDDLDADHDDDLGGDDDMGGDATSDGGDDDDDDGGNPFAKKPVTPFMKAFMAKENRVMPPDAPGTGKFKLPPAPTGDHPIKLPPPGPQGKVKVHQGHHKLPPDAPGTGKFKLPPAPKGSEGHKTPLPGPGPQGKFKSGKPTHEASESKGKKDWDKAAEQKKLQTGEDNPTFLMKKKCGSGMEDGKKVVLGKCKKCKDNMKETSNPYARPKNYDPSEAAFIKSIREQLAAANVNQKFSDGMRDFKKEDLLLAPNSLDVPQHQQQEPQPGQPGFAPQGKLGDFTAEAVAEMLARIERLEKR